MIALPRWSQQPGLEDEPMAAPANLDAFLRREDFFAESDTNKSQQEEFSEIGLTDLKETFLGMMRKPDFQRTTAAWDPRRVMQFIKSFSEGDLIPGLIFWNSPTTGNILVVDGAHRISALMAWIHDDYGDKRISQEFLGFQQNKEQSDAAKTTRKLIDSKVGPFAAIWGALENPNAKQRYKELAPNVKKRRLPVQWVRGDAEKVTESFFRINLQGVQLDKTEQKLIRGRMEPNAISTRAIVQCGEGHHYWKDFAEADATKTVERAKEIHKLLFSPPLEHPVKTLHLPIGGKAYAGTAMEVTLELVEFANRKPAFGAVGPVTVDTLQKTWRILSKINGMDSACLGLHPAVYFYSHATGKHQPSALMAVVKCICEMSDQQIENFTLVRKQFEDFLIANARILGDAIGRRGSRGRAVPTLIDYYNLVFAELSSGSAESQIYKAMLNNHRLAPFSVKLPDFNEYGPNFSAEVKSFALITDALTGAPICKICGARYHPDSVNIDHVKTKEEGGTGSPDNARATHVYCNANRKRLEPLIASRQQRST
jgi:Protein of unknown function DUF262/HNH endonuclease